MPDEKYSEGDLLEIRWIDAEEACGWCLINDLKNSPSPRCKSYGLFLHEDGQRIIIIPSITDDLECSYIKIPKGMIISIRKIEDSELEDWGSI
jgi:hypothetical protein